MSKTYIGNVDFFCVGLGQIDQASFEFCKIVSHSATKAVATPDFNPKSKLAHFRPRHRNRLPRGYVLQFAQKDECDRAGALSYLPNK